MRRTVLTTAAAVLLACSPLFATIVFADDTSTSSTTSSSTDTSTSSTDTSSSIDTSADGTDILQGIDTSVLRPGADPNDPNSYAYLPPDMPIPDAGPRTEWPAAPQASSASSSASSSSQSGSTSDTAVQVAAALNAPNQNDPNSEPDIAIGKPYTIGTQWPDATFPGVRCLMLVGEMVGSDVLGTARSLFPFAQIYNLYASTEGGVIAVGRLADEAGTGSRVMPVPGVKVRIQPINTDDAAIGEIWIRSDEPGSHT
ncbi:MAG: AMP-binding protein, partial [Alicyclobacillus sp.]|nr:AMP-binding protein [Alicyclobacillus sp.]